VGVFHFCSGDADITYASLIPNNLQQTHQLSAESPPWVAVGIVEGVDRAVLQVQNTLTIGTDDRDTAVSHLINSPCIFRPVNKIEVEFTAA